MSSNLYKRDIYTNREQVCIYDKPIYEYDIKSAGLSISTYYKLLPEQILTGIVDKSKNKKDIQKKIGLIQRSNKEYRENLKKSFMEIRKKFFIENEIEDTDIISIKKDAIFTTKECFKTNFDDIVIFNLKNTYHVFLLLDRYELYYDDMNKKIDVKGINDEIVDLHKDGILNIFNQIFYLLVNGSVDKAISSLITYINLYKAKELPYQYYREFDASSKYRTYDDIIFDISSDDMIKSGEINIFHNYQILSKLIVILICLQN